MLGQRVSPCTSSAASALFRLAWRAASSVPATHSHTETAVAISGQSTENTIVSAKEEWRRRSNLRSPVIQRNEMLAGKVYYAPEWRLDVKPDRTEGQPNPLKGYGMTPEKWEHYNKIVWPPGYIVPETGLPKRREVYHCRQSIHFSPKRAWTACQLAWRMNVDDAILQLNLQQNKGSAMLAEVLDEAKRLAADEFNVEFPSLMHVAEAFPIQSKIIYGLRRHAHENWNKIRYRYIHLYVRLEEGPGPGYKQRFAPKDGWDRMNEYYAYLRSRSVKYSLG